MLPDKSFKLLNVSEELFIFVHSDGVPWHRDTPDVALSLNLWVDLGKTTSCNKSLPVAFSPTILESEKTLSDRITVAYSTVVNECDLRVTPAQEVPRNLASKRAGAKQQAFRLLKDFKVELWSLAPLHELEIEADCLLSEV